MVTQYRVAENSTVINTLIAAAQNGKKVTVFVELKARFDEENNLATAEMMKAAGINIIFSIPGLKVHAKVALVLRRDKEGRKLTSYALSLIHILAAFVKVTANQQHVGLLVYEQANQVLQSLLLQQAFVAVSYTHLPCKKHLHRRLPPAANYPLSLQTNG